MEILKLRQSTLQKPEGKNETVNYDSVRFDDISLGFFECGNTNQNIYSGYCWCELSYGVRYIRRSYICLGSNTVSRLVENKTE